MKSEVVIVGAGVIGCSIAWHLASLGCSDVVVVDRGTRPGNGSSSRATGGFRLQFGSAINVRLSSLSHAKMLRFRDELGADCGYRPAGYLFLASTDTQLASLEEIRQLLLRESVEAMELVNSDDVARLQPHIARDTHRGGSFGSLDGFITPLAIADGYAAAAARAGVRFCYERNIDEAVIEGGRISSLISSGQRYSARVFVNAAGAWAAGLAALCGADLPVTPLRRMVAPTVATAAIPDDSPMTIWLEDGFHFRPRDGRVLLLQPDDGAPGEVTTVDRDWLQRIVRLKNDRIPSLREVAVDEEAAWGGLYEMSPDGHAIVGFDAGVQNLYFVNGSSGHGVMHAPALGELAAQSILELTPSIDISALRPSRFAEGAAVRGIDLL